MSPAPEPTPLRYMAIRKSADSEPLVCMTSIESMLENITVELIFGLPLCELSEDEHGEWDRHLDELKENGRLDFEDGSIEWMRGHLEETETAALRQQVETLQTNARALAVQAGHHPFCGLFDGKGCDCGELEEFDAVKRLTDLLTAAESEKGGLREEFTGVLARLKAASESCLRGHGQVAEELCHELADYKIQASPARTAPGGWQSMGSAPKDGTRIVLWMVHPNARHCADPVTEGWAAPVTAYWTNHNDGGWVWQGMFGEPTRWQPLPQPPDGEKS